MISLIISPFFHIETLNKTMNSGKFKVDLSGWTGKNDIFTAVADSLQTIHLISVNQERS